MEKDEVTEESVPVRVKNPAHAEQSEESSTERLEWSLALEQVYAEKLAHQLRTLTQSRLWRVTEWVRRRLGREPFIPDLSRPSLEGDAFSSHAMTATFHHIYTTNAWDSQDSHSGRGSDLRQTDAIRTAFPGLLEEFGVKTLLDIPCGDFHWMRMLDLDLDYIGADVVEALIADNNASFGDERHCFRTLDIANDSMPRVDLVMCRDLLVHFSFLDALRAIQNLKRSGSTYLLTTTFIDRLDHRDIKTGQWRVINLQLPPFNFPPPLRLIREHCTEEGMDFGDEGRDPWWRRLGQRRRRHRRNHWDDKCLGLWRLADL